MADKDGAWTRLQRVTEGINAQADETNRIIRDTNAKLAELKAGVELWLMHGGWPVFALSPDRGTGFAEGLQLGYAKVADAWQLAARPVEATQRFYEGDESMPWVEIRTKGPARALLDTSRMERVAAVAHLDDLIDALAEKLEGYLRVVERASKGPARSP